MLNAKQQEIEGEASRRQGEEEARRRREENARSLAMVRSKYAASGVTQEGSPLEVLGDAARIAETAVQDVAYTTELSSRKQYREAEIKKFEAGFSLIDEAGFKLPGFQLSQRGAHFRIPLGSLWLRECNRWRQFPDQAERSAPDRDCRGRGGPRDEVAFSMSRYQGRWP